MHAYLCVRVHVCVCVCALQECPSRSIHCPQFCAHVEYILPLAHRFQEACSVVLEQQDSQQLENGKHCSACNDCQQGEKDLLQAHPALSECLS